MTTIILQSKKLSASQTCPSGWDNRAISISGHWWTWGKAHDPIEALIASDATIETKLREFEKSPNREIHPGDVVVMDLESPIRMQTYPEYPHYVLPEIARAIQRRIHVGRSVFPQARLALYVPGFAFQDRFTDRDLEWLSSLIYVAKLGGLQDLDALWMRCYAFDQHNGRVWWKTRDVISNTKRAGEAVRRAAKTTISIICGLSWEIFGSSRWTDEKILDSAGLTEQMEIASGASYDQIHIWSGDETVGGIPVVQKAADVEQPQG